MKPKQLEQFTESKGILFFRRRVVKENPFRFKDIVQIPFIDAPKITGTFPVLLVDSPVLYSLVIPIQCQTLVHAEVEATVREVLKEVFVFAGLRNLI